MKLGFSTLACMEASIADVIGYAKETGMNAIEFRLDKNDQICGLDAHGVKAYLPILRDAGIVISDLGTSVSFQGYDAQKKTRVEQNMDLAAAVGAKAVRVILGSCKKRVTDNPPADDCDGIVRALQELCDYGETCGVEVWTETHGSFSTCADMKRIVDAVNRPNLRVIWDIIHSVEFGESVQDSVSLLGDRFAHIHVKDGFRPDDPTWLVYTLSALGAGTVDTAGAVRALEAVGFDGIWSLEWEAAWHPELIPLYDGIPALLRAYDAYMNR